MRKRLLGLLAGATIAFAACQGAASPSPSSAPPATEAPAESPAGSPTTGESPAASADTGGEVDLFGTDYAPEEGQDGGQIILSDWQEATQFNPYYLSQVTEQNVASAVWAGLTLVTHDVKYVPDLAVEIPTLDNGGVQVPGVDGDAMTVTWTLKDGLQWSDGEPLTCDDFVFTWEWQLDPDNVGLSAGTAGWEDISEWECASDTEMILHFENVYEGYLSLVVTPLPRHGLEDISIADQIAGAGFRPDEIADMPTSGAFRFESVTPGQELRLVRNDNFQNFSRNEPAHLERLIFKWYGDSDTMIAGFRGGEVDFSTNLRESDLPKVQDLGDQVSAIPALQYEFLRPNWADGSDVGEDGVGGCSRNPEVADRGDGCPVSDPAFRRAIAHAIDKNAINTRLLGGNAEVANTNISPLMWYYADQPPIEYDPAQAQQILEEAGWVDSDGDGVREKDGLVAKIELCTTINQTRQDSLALVSGWLREVGIESIVNPVDSSSIFADYNEATADTPCALSRSNFDVALHAFLSPADPLSGYFSYHSSQFRPAAQNDAQVNNPELDEAYQTVRDNVDFEVIRDAMAEVQRIYVEEVVEIPLYYRQNVELIGSRLGNFLPNATTAGPTWNASDWYATE